MDINVSRLFATLYSGEPCCGDAATPAPIFACPVAEERNTGERNEFDTWF